MSDPTKPAAPQSDTTEWFRDYAVVIRKEPRIDPDAVRRAIGEVERTLSTIKAEEQTCVEQ